MGRVNKVQKETTMRRYETIAILKPTLAEDDLKAVIDRSTSIIEGFAGSMIKLDRWGLKKLAYLIDKEQQGYYLYLQYAGTPEAVNELERIYRIDDRVMKFLTVKLQDVFSALPEDEATEEQETTSDTAKSEETETV
jgi:small subunit ribosomal protein S6